MIDVHFARGTMSAARYAVFLSLQPFFKDVEDNHDVEELLRETELREALCVPCLLKLRFRVDPKYRCLLRCAS